MTLRTPAVLSGEGTSVVKHRDGAVESLRALRMARNSAMKAKRAALQLLRNTIVSAPDRLRDSVSGLTRTALIRTCAAWRPNRDAADEPATATRIALRSLARRILALEEEIADLDGLIAPLVERINPRLTEATCVGTEIAAQLLVTAGENPERMRSEASFAMLALRGCAPAGPLREDPPLPPQSRWGSGGKLRLAHGRHKPPSRRPSHPRVRGPTCCRRTLQKGDPALSQTIPGT